MSHGLNPAQAEAVLHTDGPVLILAGAGSGKTRVLTHRVSHLIDQGVDPRNILAITFTNKAASEMKERVGNLVGPEAKDIWVATFHSTCVRLLRREIDHVQGYNRNFVIYDTGDTQSLLKQCLKEANLDDKKFPVRNVAAVISDAKNKLQNPEKFDVLAGDYFQQKCADVYKLYQQKLKANNALDFDDLIMVTVNLFETTPHVLGFYQTKFRYILVDEYQDTNHAQYMLVKLLAQRHRNLCVVGDIDQSIYGWRGADIQNILDFEHDYSEAKVIKLEQNYRSTKNILAAANKVIENNLGRKAKNLWTDNSEGHPVVYYTANDEYDEARFVSDRIALLRRLEDKKYSDFAVLYRTNAQSRAIEEVFMRSGIPYRMFGGTKFYERKEIKDIIAYLRVILNPNDSISLGRIINVPRRGIGEASFAKVAEFAAESGNSVFSALQDTTQIPGLTARSTKPMQEFAGFMERLMEARERLSVTALTEEILAKSGYMDELRAEKTPEAQSRIENLQEFLSVTKEYDATSEEGSLEGFLADVSLVSDLDYLDQGEDAVVMMTMHGAKGLEFSVVFIAGMEESIFPHSRAMLDHQEMEEERRLCYVAITRAENKLYVTNASRRNLFGRTLYNSPSRFLEEIPEELLSREDPSDPVRVSKPQAPIRKVAAGQPAGQSPLWTSYGSPLQAPKPSGSTALDYQLGDKVTHPKFGQGVIVGVKGEGP
ncbi:MAG TPA: DNA helicase PcrA, partial [Verrucomicrobiae bacterium]|nr:DNA helicase PcrA [Verrucomicrobiae bacterium]